MKKNRGAFICGFIVFVLIAGFILYSAAVSEAQTSFEPPACAPPQCQPASIIGGLSDVLSKSADARGFNGIVTIGGEQGTENVKVGIGVINPSSALHIVRPGSSANAKTNDLAQFGFGSSNDGNRQLIIQQWVKQDSDRTKTTAKQFIMGNGYITDAGPSIVNGPITRAIGLMWDDDSMDVVINSNSKLGGSKGSITSALTVQSLSGNVGIGTTNPNALLTIDKGAHSKEKISFWASSKAHMLGTEDYHFTIGPGSGYGSSVGTKFYSRDGELAGQIGFGGSGSPANRKNSYFVGSVGIGATNTGLQKLRVEGGDIGTNGDIDIGGSPEKPDKFQDAPWYGLGFNNNTAARWYDTGPIVQLGGYFGLQFAEQGSVRMAIRKGNVGIGTANPTAKLDVRLQGNRNPLRPAGTWAAIIDNTQDTQQYNGLLVANRWGGATSKIFEVGSYWNGKNEVYNPKLTVLGNGRVGIGTETPVSSLDVVGSTVKFSNLKPIYRWRFGGAEDKNWKKIADVVISTDLNWQGVSFEVEILNANTNFGASIDAIPLKYYVRMTRSGASKNSPNDAEVSGPVADYVRVVKINTGAYELQVRQPSNWKHIEVSARVISDNWGASVLYADSAVNGSLKGEIYTAAPTHTDYFSKGYFAGNVAFDGKVGIGDTQQFSNENFYVKQKLSAYSKIGTGKIKENSVEATTLPQKVVGVGTKFMQELKNGDGITINGKTYIVDKIVSDTELEIFEKLPIFSSKVNFTYHPAIARFEDTDGSSLVVRKNGVAIGMENSGTFELAVGGDVYVGGSIYSGNSAAPLQSSQWTSNEDGSIFFAGNVGINWSNPVAKLSIMPSSSTPSANYSGGISFAHAENVTYPSALSLPAGGYGSYKSPAQNAYALRLFENWGWNFTLQNDINSGFRVGPYNCTSKDTCNYFVVNQGGVVSIGTTLSSQNFNAKLLVDSDTNSGDIVLGHANSTSRFPAALALPGGGIDRALNNGYALRLFESWGWNFTLQNNVNSGFRVGPYNCTSKDACDYFVVNQGGKVGIGTTNPKTSLHIPAQGLQIGNSTFAPWNFYMSSDAIENTRGFRLYNGDYGAGRPFFTVLMDGKVGIGASVPQANLDIRDNVAWHLGGNHKTLFRLTSSDPAYHLKISQYVVTGGVVGFNFRAIRSDVTGDRSRVDYPGLVITSEDKVAIGKLVPCDGCKLDVFGGDINVSYAGDKFALKTDRVGLDVAELFESEQEVEVGDIVAVSDTERRIKKSSIAYDEKIVGVVSGSPALLFEGSELKLGARANRFEKGTKPPVALVGRIPVKVSLENGSIKSGDYLTSSSKPGIAMKATEPGMTLGIALEDYNGGSDGKIVAFINIGEKNSSLLLEKIKQISQELDDIKKRIRK